MSSTDTSHTTIDSSHIYIEQSKEQKTEGTLHLSQKQDLLSLTFEHLNDLLIQLKIPTHYSPIIFNTLHRKQQDLSSLTSLGKHLNTLNHHTYCTSIKLQNHTISQDGTIKFLFELADGYRIESVLLPMRRERYTLCLSTQVGCAMGCHFCATGTMKLSRHLTAGEVVAQVYQSIQWLQQNPSLHNGKRHLTHLVFMGMGEPLHAYESTRDALQILIDQRGISFAAHKVTLSTVGLIPAMQRFAQDFQGKVKLALSLHAGRDQTRQQIMPIAKKWSLQQLKQQLLAYPLPGRQVLLLEYVVLAGINDSDEELQAVANFCHGLRALVNLIPFNPFPSTRFRSPSYEQVLAVDHKLKSLGVACSIRVTRGQDQAAACGQLALTHS